MVRRAAMVVSGTVLALAAGACGDDAGSKPSSSAAGTSSGASQAGMPDMEPQGGSGDAGGTRSDMMGAAGAAAGGQVNSEGGTDSGGQGGEPAETASTDVVGQVFAGSTTVAKAVVVVNGLVTIADAEGKFRVRNVAPEYELMIRWPGEKLLFVYEGLTTRTPQVNVTAYTAPSPRMATVRGAFVNGWDEVPANSRKAVTYVGTQPGYSDTDLFYPRTSYEIQPRWSGKSTDHGTVYALQYLFTYDLGPYDFQGFGTREVTVTDGQELGNADGDAATDVTLTDPDDITIATNAVVPKDWDLTQSQLWIGPLQLDLAMVLGQGNIVVPKTGLPTGVIINSSGAEGRSYAQVEVKLDSDLEVATPLPPLQSSPATNATGIKEGTEFFWEGTPANGVATLNLEIGDWTINIRTLGTSARLPSLAPLHVKLPGMISGTWSMSVAGPATTMEEALALDPILNSNAAVGSAFLSWGNPRNFVTGE